MKRMYLSFLLWLLVTPLTLLAQEQTDSVAVSTGLSAREIDELTRPLSPVEGVDASVMTVAPLTPSREEMGLTDPRRDLFAPSIGGLTPSPGGVAAAFAPSYLHTPFFPRWDTGAIYGYSAQYGDWLRGYQAQAGVGLYQQLGDQWSFVANASVYKNSIYYNAASLDGRLTWRPNSHFGVTVFGSYSPGSFLSPVDLGQSFRWGGFVTLEGERFGIDLGAQTYYDPWMGHDVEPIVMPYFKMGEAKLGIDIGPMLKNALQKDRRDGPGFNPIPQPIKAVPQIAPRR